MSEVLALPAHPHEDGPHRAVVALVALVVVFTIVLIAWSAIAELDVAVQARGVVVASNRLQEVQSLEGGIVKEMLVVPGQRVKQGQVLARLDTAQASSEVGESRQQQLAALAGRARVDALLGGYAPRFDDELRREAPALIDKEMQLWRDALHEYQSNQAAMAENVRKRAGEIEEAQVRLVSLQESVRLAEEAFAIEDRLFKGNAGARADYLAAQQKLVQQRTELESVTQSLPRLRAGLAEARAQAAEASGRTRAQWGSQRTEYEAKAAMLAAGLVGKQDKQARREVIAPMDGVVNRVLVYTIGGVAGAGKPILEIVPDDARLQMTARVRPTDIGFVHASQKAHVKLLPYDASTYGSMDAEVDRVGADAVTDEKGEAYFEVQLSAAPGQLKLHGRPLPITPGMPADVGILTGKRTVLQYLFKPVLRGIQGALQER